MSNDQKNTGISEMEEKILKFWNEKKIFEKSLNRKAKNNYIFYDGPPFATGLPHYGHILTSIIKDTIPRYQTMKGKRVERKWGWDCHGLPIENLIEQDLNLKTRKDIEKYGIENFNEAARKKVVEYVNDWKKIIPRIGRWVDMENAYKTMDPEYTESVWWAFKKLFDKKLVYEGYKSMHICPRCETTLSNFEVAQGYKDIEDFSVIVKFKLKSGQKIGNRKIPNNTYFLAWTTTPWTLPGNVALAVKSADNFVFAENKNKTERIIVGENYYDSQLNPVFPKYDSNGQVSQHYRESFYPNEISPRLPCNYLEGIQYEPLFDYYSQDKKLENRERGWKVYGADFVSTSEGTGIVHIAPAFGADDMDLGKKYNLPFIQHVGMDGKFKNEVKDFAGLPVKPKDAHQSTDNKVIEWLDKNKKLFKSEKSTHSYPHCWRCETPLLNYAAFSWFVKISGIKKGKGGLIENNKKINWVPSHIKSGRFGKILEDAPDWAVSRSRYWGAPLPVWRCQKCDKTKVIGSVEELKNASRKSGNDYFVMRHGEAKSNATNVVSSNQKTSSKYPLTEKGRSQATESAKKFAKLLKNKKPDIIFSSDFTRAKETAQITAEMFGFPKNKIIFDKRLREINTGLDGQKIEKYINYFSSYEERFIKTPPGGENFTEIKNRVSEFIYEIDAKYKNKNILIVSHEAPLWLMAAGAMGADTPKTIRMKKKPSDDFITFAEIKKLEFSPLPHNRDYELDFHRPYIDEIKLPCACDGVMKRENYVFDCWFESGSMPYAQSHYPFSKNLNFPAEFIAEGIDQTRGWFYTLHVLGAGLFNKESFKNVIVNGIVLAEDGQKMSKRLKNYPDPMEIVEKYGADALRYYLLSSPIVRSEDLNFSEKAVDEIYKKVILRLMNVLSFYQLYTDSYGLKQINADKKISINQLNQHKSVSILDKWILARLNALEKEITKAMDSYELDKATRPIADFVDDLSTWYIRRSRDRFKSGSKDKLAAISTTRTVLLEFSKIIAPFMPFVAEHLYKSIEEREKGKDAESVHLTDWPKLNKSQISNLKSQKLLDGMKEVRKFASFGLEARAKAGIKVRQPLASLEIRNPKSEIRNNKELLQILADEINVKKIVFSAQSGSASGGDSKTKGEVELNTEITPELRMEGVARDFVRIVQDLRKKAGLMPQDKIYLWLEVQETIKSAINANLKDFKEKIGAKNIEFKRVSKFDAEEETKFEGQNIWIGIKKV